MKDSLSGIFEFIPISFERWERCSGRHTIRVRWLIKGYKWTPFTSVKLKRKPSINLGAE